ncbi:MAG: hypothetical protein QXY52_01840 [Conexivisphaerales archaeon]
MHFAVDIKTKQVVSMNASSDKVGDGRRLRRLVNRASESVRVSRVLGDGRTIPRPTSIYFLDGRRIKPIIRIRSNSVPKASALYWGTVRSGGLLPRITECISLMMTGDYFKYVFSRLFQRH